MCGIAGFIDNNRILHKDYCVIEQMTHKLLHRGPDDKGFFFSDKVALGHRRLRIIDLNSGQQPLYNEDKTVVVIFNGEIYNYLTLKDDLLSKKHVFKTNTDTEVIVHAWEEYEEGCLEKFRGMFAIALYDSKKGIFFLARDRVGKKPLYYQTVGDRLYFASEIKSIIAATGKTGVNHNMIDFYVSLGYVPGPDTLFEGIRKLLPGHWLKVMNGKTQIKRFWDPSKVTPISIKFETAEAHLERLLSESVKLRMISDVPIGAFLSGGIDSSAIVAFMSKHAEEPVKTFTVGYSDDIESSEIEYARIVANHFKTDHYEYILSYDDFFTSLDLLLEHVEEPIVESAAVALFKLSKLARENVTVLLSGEGGDEVLSGYPLHYITKWINYFYPIAKMIPTKLQKAISKYYVKDNEKKAKYFDWLRSSFRERYHSISNDVTDTIRKMIYQDEFNFHAAYGCKAYFEKLHDQAKFDDLSSRMSYIDILSWLPDDLLLKADKMTMATSVELRVPFLDHLLVEFCLSLSGRYKLRRSVGKYLLKKLMEKYLPRKIVYRKKLGFPVPIKKWFKENLYEKTSEILLDPKCLSRGYFKYDYIKNTLRNHRDGHQDLSRRLFSLLTLELWHKMYID